MRVLCTGDLHIGRRPSRLPAHVEGRAHSCAAAWGRIVDLALERQVDIVALSGDLVDQANRYYEASGPLEAGLRRLTGAGIDVVAVAGNHDHDVLPQLALLIQSPRFALLGRGGTWTRHTIERAGERLYVDGWSFPDEHVRECPLDLEPLPAPDDGTPVLGLLHADLDASGSSYAPVSLARLREHHAALWLLGHVHVPALHTGAAGTAAVLYPGSPQPMDPGERGAHGVWLVDVRAGATPQPRLVPIATVRYEAVTVDMTGTADADAVRGALDAQLRAHAASVVRDHDALRHLALRARVIGRTPAHRQIAAELRRAVDDLAWEEGAAAVFLERADAETAPARDLDRLAEGSDVAALVARILRAVATDPPGDDAGPLTGGLPQIAAALGASPAYARLSAPVPDHAALHRALAGQAASLLDILLAQREVAA